MEINAADYVQKLRMLEERLGETMQYKILSPFRCNPKDAVDLQNAARSIAAFVGLQDLTFIVAIARQKEKIGGHVELNTDQTDVFVEISLKASRSSATTLAILAHEISHKLLHSRGISLGRGLLQDYENEILTDITAVFIGLGKLMLNGAEVRTEAWKVGQRAIESIRTGYLNAQQLAFVYRLVCAMRGVSKREMMTGLTSQAKSAIRSCRQYESRYFDRRFRDEDYRQKLIRGLRSEMNHVREKIQEMRKRMHTAKRDLIDEPAAYLLEVERDLSKLNERIRVISNAEIYDPCFRFLDTLDMAAETRCESRKLIEAADRAEQWVSDFGRVLRNSRIFREHKS